MKYENKLGSIEIANDVFCAIAGYAATLSFGVKGMASAGLKDGIVRLINSDSMGKGVKAVMRDGRLHIELHIVVRHGVNLSAISQSMIEAVRYKVEELTGVTVDHVAVCIDSILAD